MAEDRVCLSAVAGRDPRGPVRSSSSSVFGASAGARRAETSAPDAGGRCRSGSPTWSPVRRSHAAHRRAAAPPARGRRLLLTEVVLAPTTGEFVEIANPTATDGRPHDLLPLRQRHYFRLAAGRTASTRRLHRAVPRRRDDRRRATITVALDTAANFQTAVRRRADVLDRVGGTMISLRRRRRDADQLRRADRAVLWDGGTISCATSTSSSPACRARATR